MELILGLESNWTCGPPNPMILHLITLEQEVPLLLSSHNTAENRTDRCIIQGQQAGPWKKIPMESSSTLATELRVDEHNSQECFLPPGRWADLPSFPSSADSSQTGHSPAEPTRKDTCVKSDCPLPVGKCLSSPDRAEAPASLLINSGLAPQTIYRGMTMTALH